MLLGVFAFNTTPREFIHQFVSHTDTDETRIPHEGIAFSAKHQHCDFLQIEPEPYVKAGFFYSAFVQHVLWRYATPFMPVTKHMAYRAVSLRAPPVTFPV